jgi:GT2 family glycosyltransferase
MSASCLEELVKVMESDKKIGVAQSLLLMYPETEIINNAGNAFHYLGLGFSNEFRTKKSNLVLGDVEKVGYASGASLIMRSDLLKEYGLWQKEFFMYHEDLEYSMKMKILGFKTVLAGKSIFYHKYQFSRSKDKFYQMEKNRYAVLLKYYKWPTLIFLLPIELVLELGLLIYSIMNGILLTRLRVYKYWLSLSSWKFWLNERSRVQRIRKVSDKELLRGVTSRIVFEEKSINNPLLKYIGNPLMAIYWFVFKAIIFW